MSTAIEENIQILIVDDHEIVRKGLKLVLNDTPDMRVTGEAENSQDLMKELNRNGFNVVLLDIAIPGTNALDTLKEIKAQHPRLPVLIYSMYPEDRYAVRFIRAGASGYLNKSCSMIELVKAIRKAAEGRKYISESLAEKLANYLEKQSDQPPHNLLSDREYQVFCLLASGKSISEIAEDLGLSPTTISTYRFRILEKFKMKNNSQLTQYALQNKLID